MRRDREPALWPAAVVAAVLFGVAFYLLQAWLERGRLTDLAVYQSYAQLMRGGKVPYRDFAVEYPPAALPALLLPAYLPWSYATSFAVVMGGCGAVCIAAVAAVLRALGSPPARAAGALLLVGVSPLVLGALFDSRFDLWPLALAVGALAFVAVERPVPAGVLGGLAFAAKLWPFVLAPVGLAYLWRRDGRRAAVTGGAAFIATAAACFLPFAALTPAGVRHSLSFQLDRPLQVESLGAAFLMAAQHLGGPVYPTVESHGGQALAGALPNAIAAATTGVELTAVIAVWLMFARRRRPGPEALVLASAASVTTLVAFAKVFSPQYLIWVVPFVPLVRGRRGAAASTLLLAALGLTQAWFPTSYWALALDHATPYSWLLLARDLVVATIAVVLAWPSRLGRTEPGDQRARLAALRALRTSGG